jgi:dienelactone hydrolase
MTTPLRQGIVEVLIWGVIGPTLAAAQQAAAPPFSPPDDIQFRTGNVMSEGTRMAAELFSLKALDGKKLPTVILCHGWGGTTVGLRPNAVAFARAGYLAVAFDYRGWGNSDSRVILTAPAPARGGRTGPSFAAEVREVREVVDPLDQTTDLQNVVHWVQGESQCDTDHIGLWGSSYSGGHVIYVAARDPRVKATVSQVPALDSRWVIATPQDRALTYREATDRARGTIGYPEPGARVIKSLRGGPIRERMIDYAPVEDVARAQNCAMLFIMAETEEYFDNKDHGVKAYDRAGGPKKSVTIPGITHYGIYGAARPQAQKLAIEWFDTHLKPQASGAGPSPPSNTSTGVRDWPSYNHAVIGSLHHQGDTVVASLRYSGTVTDPAYSKRRPDGRLQWSYRNRDKGVAVALAPAARRWLRVTRVSGPPTAAPMPRPWSTAPFTVRPAMARATRWAHDRGRALDRTDRFLSLPGSGRPNRRHGARRGGSGHIAHISTFRGAVPLLDARDYPSGGPGGLAQIPEFVEPRVKVRPEQFHEAVVQKFIR